MSIAAMQGEVELTRATVLVWPVHRWLVTGQSADFQKAYDYITWKYAAVLATTGGSFSSVTFSTSGCVSCGFQSCVYACTSWNPFTGYSVVFGTNTFDGTENQAASIIGHELVHTAVGLLAGECPTYTWEMDHSQQTGIFECDTQYLGTVVQKQNCACNGCP